IQSLKANSGFSLSEELQFFNENLAAGINLGLLAEIDESLLNLRDRTVLIFNEDGVPQPHDLNILDYACQIRTLVSLKDYSRLLRRHFTPSQMKYLPKELTDFTEVTRALGSGQVVCLIDPHMRNDNQGQYSPKTKVISFPSFDRVRHDSEFK